MALLEINRTPTTSQLRWFALLWFPLLAGVVGAAVGHRTGLWIAAAVPWGCAALVAVVGAVAPRAVRPLFVGLMVASYPVGFVVSHAVLAITYFAVLTPIGLLTRLAGRDPLRHRRDRGAKTYWRRREPPSSVDRYYRQF